MQISLTYLGVATMLLGKFLEYAGVQVEESALRDFLTTGLSIAGACVTLYGRWRAGGIKWHGKKL